MCNTLSITSSDEDEVNSTPPKVEAEVPVIPPVVDGHMFGANSVFKDQDISKLLCLPKQRTLTLFYTEPTFEAALFAYLSHTAKLGKYMVEAFACLAQRDIQQISDDDEALQNQKRALKGNQKAINLMTTAWNSEGNRDKYMPWRMCSPSAKMVKLYAKPALEQGRAIFLFRLLVWRVWGFGRPKVIERLKDVTGAEDALAMLETIDKAMYGGKFSKKKKKKGQEKCEMRAKSLSGFPAYGQFCVPKKLRTEMLRKMEIVAGELDTAMSRSLKVLTFEEVRVILASADIPRIAPHGLIPWLYTSDLFEYGLVASPTVSDLADKIIGKAGGGGLVGALLTVTEGTGLKGPTVNAANKREIERLLASLLANLKQRLDVMSIQLQDREFSVVDLEHMLCKVSREGKISSEAKEAIPRNAKLQAKRRIARISKRKMPSPHVEIDREDTEMQQEDAAVAKDKIERNAKRQAKHRAERASKRKMPSPGVEVDNEDTEIQQEDTAMAKDTIPRLTKRQAMRRMERSSHRKIPSVGVEVDGKDTEIQQEDTAVTEAVAGLGINDSAGGDRKDRRR